MVIPRGADVLEEFIMEFSPELMSTLLKDHTTSKSETQVNIFWGTDDYKHLGHGYRYHDPILPKLITGDRGHVIMPRILKAREAQEERIREMAEVFTPSWVCNLQNNQIDEMWFGRKGVFNHTTDNRTWQSTTENIRFPRGKTWKDYVQDIRMEITCGEAPYMTSRYDTTTGEEIPIKERIGILDRKLRVVSENTEKSGEWLKWAQKAYMSIYGYEWQGDNLLIARENLLMAFVDSYREKYGRDPLLKSLQYIAYIISWNFWQMDGLKGVVPETCGVKASDTPDLFGHIETVSCPGCKNNDLKRHNGTYCIIRNWKTKEKLRYIDLFSH